MSAEWLEAVSAVSTVVLAVLTAYYARLTHNLLKIQVEPRVEFSVDQETPQLVLKNWGAYPVWDVSIECNTRALPGPVECYGETANLQLIKKLRAGESHKIPIEDVGVTAVRMLKQVEQSLSTGDTPAQAWVRFSLSWQRDFDRRVFQAVKRF